MAAVVANVNTGGIGSVEEPVEKLQDGHRAFYSMRCSKTIQHFIDNNNASLVPVVTAVTGQGGTGATKYEQGYYYIPWTELTSSTTPARAQQLVLSKRYRVKSMGFNIKKMQACQQQISTNSATTSISTSFVQAPYILLAKDDAGDLFESTFDQAVVNADTTLPIWRVPTTGQVGSGFGTSYNTHKLPLTCFILEGGNSFDPIVDLFIDGDLTLLNSGQNYSESWTNPIKNWVSPQQTLVREPDLGNTYQPLLTAMSLLENTATEVTQNFSPPRMHLLRVPPMFDTLGPMILSFELLIEYWVEYEIEMGRYFNRLMDGGGNIMGTSKIPFFTNKRTINRDFNSVDGEIDPERVRSTAKRGKYMTRV